MTVAMVFPGQGSQRGGMASAWRDHPAFAILEEVAEAADIPDLAELADDPEACESTAVAQPAMFAVSLVAWRALEDVGVRADLVAGHSLGEYAAAVAAGCLSIRDGAALVAERGRASADAIADNPGVMSAILGLDRAAVEEALAEVDGAVVVNDNGPRQVVIAGPSDAVASASEACRDAGGRVRELDVEGAFHTSTMAPARDRLAERLESMEVHDPSIPLVSGATAQVSTTAEEVRQGLVDGMLSPVRWREVMQRFADRGVELVVEAGPGEVLTGLAQRNLSDVQALSVAGPDDLDEVAAAVEDVAELAADGTAEAVGQR
ncbi:MAG TPA: ACP S-malonyltransferase [Nitriliruptorales bacterium]|nr:ACP S-malonyltransferase [Nitriliruptorales bacterium]